MIAGVFGVPRTTAGSQNIAWFRYYKLAEAIGADHPATRAALGRWRFYAGWVPAKLELGTPEAIGWLRESGARPGWLNRAERHAALTRAGRGAQ